MSLRALFILALAVLAPLHAQAASYVSDRLTAPLRGLNATDGPVVKQIIAGAPVTVLERDSPLYKVKTEDGSVGYLDPAQISGEKPLQVLYIEMTDRYNKVQDQLRSAQAQGNNSSGRDDKTLADLRSELKSALDRLTDTERAAQVSTAQLSAAQAKNASLEVELSEVKRQLGQAQANLGSGGKSNGSNDSGGKGEFFPDGTMPASAIGRTGYSTAWMITAAILALVLGAGLGGFTVDYYIRQRHGGFRTY